MSAIMNYTKQEETQSHDNTKLVQTASKILLTSVRQNKCVAINSLYLIEYEASY